MLSILLLVCDVPHLTTSSAMTTQQLILFLLFALLRPMPTWSMTTKEMNTVDWFNLIRYLFGLGFVIFGATSLLYSHLSTYLLLQKYKSTGKTISGQVLSCEEDPRFLKKFSLEIFYRRGIKQQADSEEAVRRRDYVLQACTDWKFPPGTKTDLLVLPDEPKSACTTEIVDANLYNHSHLFTILVLIPSMTLTAAFLFLIYREIASLESTSEQVIASTISVVWASVCCCISYFFCRARFHREKSATFPDAVRVNKRKEQDSSKTMEQLDSKSWPLMEQKDEENGTFPCS